MAKKKILSGSQCPHCGQGIAYKLQVDDEQYWQCKRCKMTFQDKDNYKYEYKEYDLAAVFTISNQKEE